MNVLITNIWLENYGGTECYVRDLAITLKKEGINVEVYSPKLGSIANDIKKFDINVVSSVNDLKNIPDIIHGQHNVAMDVISKFPNTPVVFFCHGIDIYGEPIVHKNIVKYIAVSSYISEKLLEPFFQKEKIQVIYNWVDIERFKQKEEINDIPKKALIFSNYFPEEKINIISQACMDTGINLSGIGNHINNSMKTPEIILGQYDIVFSIGKSAIESMACGCAVILCGFDGLLGEMIDSNNFEYARKYNFGLKNLNREAQSDYLIKEIEKYNASDIKIVSDRIRKEADFKKSLKEIISLYFECKNNT